MREMEKKSCPKNSEFIQIASRQKLDLEKGLAEFFSDIDPTILLSIKNNFDELSMDISSRYIHVILNSLTATRTATKIKNIKKNSVH